MRYNIIKSVSGMVIVRENLNMLFWVYGTTTAYQLRDIPFSVIYATQCNKFSLLINTAESNLNHAILIMSMVII